MAVIVTPDDAEDRVALHITLADEPGAQELVDIYRVVAGEETLVAGALVPLCDEVYFNDTNPPRGIEFAYRIRTSPDDIDTTTAGITLSQPDDVIWFRDPHRPWADLSMQLCARPDTACPTDEPVPCITFVRWGPETYAADANLLPIHDREHPAVVYARRKGMSGGTLRFITRHVEGECACIEAVRTIFTGGGAISLGFPAVYCIPDRCYQPGDVTMSYLSDRVDQRKPWRLWEVPLVAVDCPAGVKQGLAGATWCDVNEQYGTYADLTGTGQLWGEIRDGLPVPSLLGYGFGPYGEGGYGL